MNSKTYWGLLLLLGTGVVMWSCLLHVGVGVMINLGMAEAATRRITAITTPAEQISDTIKYIGWVLAPVLIVVAVLQHRGGHSIAAIFEVVGALIVIAIMVFSDEIITAFRGQAVASTGLLPTTLPTLAAWWEMGRALGASLFHLAALTEGIRRVRRAARI